MDKELVWPTNSIKYLGINMPLMQYDDLFLSKKNFGTIIDEMKTILNIWSSGSLTLLGKITVLKNLIIPKIIYKVSHLPIFLPDSFVNELNQILFRFIWGSKWEKISRLKLCCNIKEVGANMIDIKCHMLSIKLKWIQKLFDSNYVSAWKYIEKMCLKENLFFCILRSNLKMNNMLIKKLVVTKNSKNSILTLKTILKTIDHHFDESYLWLNKLVKYQNKPIFIEEFYSFGIYIFSN